DSSRRSRDSSVSRAPAATSAAAVTARPAATARLRCAASLPGRRSPARTRTGAKYGTSHVGGTSVAALCGTSAPALCGTSAPALCATSAPVLCGTSGPGGHADEAAVRNAAGGHRTSGGDADGGRDDSDDTGSPPVTRDRLAIPTMASAAEVHLGLWTSTDLWTTPSPEREPHLPPSPRSREPAR